MTLDKEQVKQELNTVRAQINQAQQLISQLTPKMYMLLGKLEVLESLDKKEVRIKKKRR